MKKHLSMNTDHQFTLDSIRQLKSGLEVIVFTKVQLYEVKRIYKQETNLDLEVVEKDYYFTLIPKEKVYKHENY